MESFNQLQSLISPKFTWEILEGILCRQQNSENVNILKITLGNPTKKGDSFLSNIVRFSVEYSPETSDKNRTFILHVIAKFLLKNIARRKTFRNSDFFENELLFYTQVWPQLNAFQKERNPRKLFDEIPNFLHGECDGTNDYILLEDLSCKGYQPGDGTEVLSFDRAKLVLKILAHFHALGHAFKQIKPDLFKKTSLHLKETYYHENIRPWYQNFHNGAKQIALDAVQQELTEDYYKKFEALLSGDTYGEAIKLCSPLANSKYRTITHGDTWMPNFLIHYDESKQPLHSVMIDFQIARFSSFAIDLHFFVYACTSAQLYNGRYKDMLEYYCQEFNEFFRQLCPHKEEHRIALLTYDDLIHELKVNALIMCIEGCVVLNLTEEDLNNLETMKGEEAVPLEGVWIPRPIKKKEMRIYFAEIIKHMIDHKFI